MTPESAENEGPTIVLDQNRRLDLEAKLDEYTKRFTDDMRATDDRVYESPENRGDLVDAAMKIAVLTTLIHDGIVRTFALSRELMHKDPFWEVEYFENACAVIDNYNGMSSAGVQGGTGLPAPS